MTGSLGYAERLSWRDDLGGQLGDPELSEADADLERKVDALADLVADAKAKGGAVVHTGAGISTSVGIPDFRGPNGIWTLQKEGKSMPAASCRFDRARPSFTHVALVALQREGYVRYLVSCNVDCLHVRSGYPREEMAELHGNCFAERCELCETEYVRDFEMPSVGFKTTGRRCVAGGATTARVAAVVSATRCSTGRTLTSRGIETRGTRIQGGCARARPRVESADHAELRLAPQDDEETTRRFEAGNSPSSTCR